MVVKVLEDFLQIKVPRQAPPAPTSRSGPEGIYWGELEVQRVFYSSKSPKVGGFRGPVGELAGNN